MLVLIVFLGCLFAAAAFGVLAAISDFRGMTIPNLYSIFIFSAFGVCYAALFFFGGVEVFAPLLSHVIAFAVVFCITLILFFAKIWGAGDQKLISAFAIWMGLQGLLPFLVYTTLIGGVLGVVALILQKFKPVQAPAEGSWVARVQDGQGKVPYGIAITLGALASFVKIGYFNVDTFRIFLGS